MAAKARVLVVDDEEDGLQVYAYILRKADYSVRTASSGNKAYALAAESPPDLVVSDVSMDDGDGLSLLARLRADKNTARIPVILLSGVREDESDQAEGLSQGADDYVVKPVSPELLLAKIAAVLRRFQSPAELKDILKTHGLTIDVTARTVTSGRKKIALTRKEFDLLTTFLRKPHRVLSVPFLLETVWNYDPAEHSDPHTVEAHLSTLRRKIGPKLAAKIVALPGLGYRFDP